MTLAARRARAILLGLVLPAAGLGALSYGGLLRRAQVDEVATVLTAASAFLLLPLLVSLAWLGKLGGVVQGMEEGLRRTVALWSPEPGALWLAWAARCGNLERARRWLRRAADEGHPEGRLELALACQDGAYGVGGEMAALPLLEGLARAGHPDGMAHYALALFWGRGRARDLEGAYRWMRRAAEQGHGGAAAWLARAYAAGEGLPPDEAEASRWRARATADALPRTSLLARLRDPSAAGRWESAAVQAHRSLAAAFDAIFADPQLRRGFLFLAGALLGTPLLVLVGVVVVGWTAAPVFFIPVPICLLLAWTWHDRRIGVSRATHRLWEAAEGGAVEAQFQLGRAFERGDQDHPQDPCAARAWYLRAAEAGHADAAYRLGELFAWGQGGPRDRQEAQRWLRRAAEQGHAGARTRLAELELYAADADR